MTFFTRKHFTYPAKFPNDRRSLLHKTAFHHCTFQVNTAHFVQHCTLKQSLLPGVQGIAN